MIHLTSVLKGQLDPVFSSKDEHIFANIRTAKSTCDLLYDKSHSKTHTTIIIYIPFSILLQILASPAKNRKNRRF